MKNTYKYNWYNVTLNQFTKLQEALSIEDEEERVIVIAEIILGTDVIFLPLKDFKEQVKRLDFLKEEIPNPIPPKSFEICGRKYFTDCLLGNISTAQYIDFINHSQTNDMAKILSVFIIPEGHKYNDGYDMLQVISDINDLPIPIVNSIAFFFERQLNKFMEIFQSYSIKRIKKMNLPKKERNNMIKVVKDSVDLALYPLLLNSVK